MSDEPKDLTIDTHLVDDQIAADPDMAAAITDFFAKMRQAYDAVQRGQYATMDDALKALGIETEKLNPETGEVIEGASFHEDMGLDGGPERELFIDRIEERDDDD